MNNMEYYRIWTDLWRWFRSMNDDPERFQPGWWERLVNESNQLGAKYPGIGKNIVLAVIEEFETVFRRSEEVENGSL